MFIFYVLGSNQKSLWAAACLLCLFGLNGCSYSLTTINERHISDCSSDEILEEAQAAFDRGDNDQSAHLSYYITKERPDSVETEDALYLAAESYYQLGDLKASFLLFEELSSKYPATQYSQKILERDFDIGKRYFADDSLLFGAWARSRGVKAMNHLLAYFPRDDLADDALYAIGEHYFKEGEYIDAAYSFERLIREYPLSEWAEKSLIQTGRSTFRMNKGPSYDRESLLKSIVNFRLYSEKYPGGGFEEECRRFLSQACNQMAEKEMEIALFYLDQGETDGARCHFSNVVLLFPDTSAGRRASLELDKEGWDTSLNSVDTILPVGRRADSGF